MRRDSHDATMRPAGRRPLTTLTRCALTTAGVLCVAVGTIGVVVPLLPTTPFLLLAAACFARSSDRFYDWLMGHRWFGLTIRNYRERRGTTRRVKIAAIAFLWSSIAFSAGLAVDSWPSRIALALVAVVVTAHVLMLRSVESG